MQLLVSLAEDYLGVGFVHEDGVRVGRYSEEEDDPLGPAPAFVLDDEAAYYRACVSFSSVVGVGIRGWAALPNAGPENGANVKMLIPTALVAGENMSAIDPPPTANAGPANTPAKNRQITKDAMFWEQPAPNVKSAKTGKVIR